MAHGGVDLLFLKSLEWTSGQLQWDTDEVVSIVEVARRLQVTVRLNDRMSAYWEAPHQASNCKPAIAIPGIVEPTPRSDDQGKFDNGDLINHGEHYCDRLSRYDTLC